MIWFTHTPTDRALHESLPDTAPETGIITFSARPSRRSRSQYQDLFTAIGIDITARTTAAHDTPDTDLIAAWLEGYEIGHLVVRHATRLVPDTLDGLIAACESTDTTLVLTEDYGLGAVLANTVMDRGGHKIPYEHLCEQYEQAPRAIESPASDGPVRFPARLPQCDFYLWRSTCRHVLTPDEFETVDALYRHTFRDFRDNPAQDPDDMAQRLMHAFEFQEPSAALTIVRAAQAACFTNKMLLKVDLSTLLSSIENQEFRRLTAGELRSLRIYRAPWLATVVTLFDANLSTHDIETMKTADIEPDGTVRGRDIHPAGLPYLRAQRHLQLSLGKSSLNSSKGRAAASALRFVSLDLSIPLMNRVPVRARKADRWQHTIGVSLLPLSKGPQQ